MHHPPRVLGLAGATNFRDLGGYAGLDGRAVRWRRLFRSDHLAGLTDADRATVAGLGVARALDFRGVAERAAHAYDLPGIAQHSLAIEPSVVQRMEDLEASGIALTPERMADLMEELYLRLVTDQAPRFAQFFAHVLASEAPLVFHCTAGKDRTGVAAALLLLALGVSLHDVREDFLLTNVVYRQPYRPSARLAPEVQAVLWGVQERYLDAALRSIETEGGGLQRYLTERMGLSPAARATLAERYLAA